MRLGMTMMVLLLLAMPGAAAAQDDGTPVASGGDARLSASRDRDGDLCLNLRFRQSVGDRCGGRVTLHEPAVAEMRGVAGGAVVTEVAQVEVEWPDGARTAVPTSEHAAFPGLRFFLAVHGSAEPWLVRYRAADGTLLAVTEEGDGPAVAGPVTLARGGTRRDGGRWSVRAWLGRTLAPAPGALDRTEVVSCLERRLRTSTGTRCSGGEPLLEEPINGDVFPTGDRTLGRRDPHRLVMSALLGPAAASAEVHLGDGRRVMARVRELSGGGASGRFATYAVPARAAVRRIVVRDAAGAEIDQQVVTLAPGTLGDDGHGTMFSMRPPLPGTPEVAAGPAQDGEGVLKVREVGARLCAEVEGSYEEGKPCGLLPLTARESLLIGGGTDRQGVVGGVVSPDVATVELIEQEAFGAHEPATVRVATQAPSPYAGAFAAHVRTFAAVLPMGGFVTVRLLDARGEELFHTTVDAMRFAGNVERRPRTRLRIGRVRLLADAEDTDCVFLQDAGAGLLHQSCAFGEDEVEAHVACRPAASVVILSAKRRRGMVLRTARGRTLRPRRLKLAGVPHAIFVVPAPDAPRAVRWRGGRVALGPVASPREQCGYKVRRSLLR